MNIEVENNVKIKALKKIAGTKWSGTTVHGNLDSCLTAINLQSFNSGRYTPKCIKIAGVKGYFLINENGSIFWEARVIKESEDKYKIEYLTWEGFNQYEELYNKFIEEYES